MHFCDFFGEVRRCFTDVHLEILFIGWVVPLVWYRWPKSRCCHVRASVVVREVGEKERGVDNTWFSHTDMKVLLTYED